MPAPDSTLDDVRSSVLRYLRMYEEGRLTLGDLAAELAAMAAPYEHAMGAIEDHFRELLVIAKREYDVTQRNPFASLDVLEEAVTKFRRSEAEW